MFSFLRLLAALVCFGLGISYALAQEGTITRAVSLHSGPSSHKASVAQLKKGDTVTLLEAAASAGFYHVKTSDGQEGWVLARDVAIQSGQGPSSPSNPSNPTAPTSTSTQCDDSLWQHVYKPQRLTVKNKCIEVTGTIVDATANQNTHHADGVRHEADGDSHGWLKPDPQFQNLLNAGNQSNEGGNLVFEIVCLFPVSQADAVSSCTGYHSSLTIPPVGSHVRIRGSYVQDTNHQKWMEIHPVSSITPE